VRELIRGTINTKVQDQLMTFFSLWREAAVQARTVCLKGDKPLMLPPLYTGDDCCAYAAPMVIFLLTRHLPHVKDLEVITSHGGWHNFVFQPRTETIIDPTWRQKIMWPGLDRTFQKLLRESPKTEAMVSEYVSNPSYPSDEERIEYEAMVNDSPVVVVESLDDLNKRIERHFAKLSPMFAWPDRLTEAMIATTTRDYRCVLPLIEAQNAETLDETPIQDHRTTNTAMANLEIFLERESLSKSEEFAKQFLNDRVLKPGIER